MIFSKKRGTPEHNNSCQIEWRLIGPDRRRPAVHEFFFFILAFSIDNSGWVMKSTTEKDLKILKKKIRRDR